MIIKFSDDLKKEEIFANGDELAGIMGFDRQNGKRVLFFPLNKKVFVYSFSNPVLLTDNYRISKLNPTLRDTLFSLYAEKPRIVEYAGVSTLWDNTHRGVWCPSIDTLLFAKCLKKVLEKRSFDDVAEIGCGSGFLSKFVLSKGKIKSIVINDLNQYAIKSAKDNIEDKRAKFFIGDGLKLIQKKKFDLLICNPPYVPREESIDDNPYEGIGLLNHLIHDGQKYLKPNGIIITNISSLCWSIVLKEKSKMKMDLLGKMKVPLKINNILNNKSWLEYLKKLGLKKDFHDGYEYWQEINIVAFTNI
ncbi:class I SAM-dependent methyltransferase [Candidatus Pacearchaeota archaeon]|nr:class I SAM-dependent methyltransferase [Candidatus Pacearchaeota archaeon]